MATFLLAAAAAFLFCAVAVGSWITGAQATAVGFAGLGLLALAVATLRPPSRM